MTAAPIVPRTPYEGIQMVGTVLDERPNQALLICDNSRIATYFDMTNVNRDIDAEWVAEMRTALVKSHEAGIYTTITVALDLRDFKSLLDNEEGFSTEGFRLRVNDGQHRLMALSQLYHLDPTKKYNFYVMVYVVNSSEEEKELLDRINRHRPFTQKDTRDVIARKNFLNVWEEVTSQDHQKRLCVQNIRSSKRIRSPEITEALARMTPDQMRMKLYQIAQSYYPTYQRACEDPRFARSVVHRVIHDTKLYQLVLYSRGKDDSWLEELAYPKPL